MAERIFLGYHGTKQAHAESILKGFDPTQSGGENGAARGPGFYAFAQKARAKSDYADNFEEPAMLKVYCTRQPTVMFGLEGGECAWGIQSGGNDPNGDAIIRKSESTDELEIVLRPSFYEFLRAEQIKVEGEGDETPTWPNYPVKIPPEGWEAMRDAAINWQALKAEKVNLENDQAKIEKKLADHESAVEKLDEGPLAKQKRQLAEVKGQLEEFDEEELPKLGEHATKLMQLTEKTTTDAAYAHVQMVRDMKEKAKL